MLEHHVSFAEHGIDARTAAPRAGRLHARHVQYLSQRRQTGGQKLVRSKTQTGCEKLIEGRRRGHCRKTNEERGQQDVEGSEEAGDAGGDAREKDADQKRQCDVAAV